MEIYVNYLAIEVTRRCNMIPDVPTRTASA